MQAAGRGACLPWQEHVEEVARGGEDCSQRIAGLAGAHVDFVGLLLHAVTRHVGEAQHDQAALLPAQAQPPGIARVHPHRAQRCLRAEVPLPEAGVACRTLASIFESNLGGVCLTSGMP